MRVKWNYVAPALAAAATATAIAAAPIAVAAPSQGAAGAGAATSSDSSPQQSCVSLGGSQSQCQSPGNAQVYDAPPQVDYFPYAGGAT